MKERKRRKERKRNEEMLSSENEYIIKKEVIDSTKKKYEKTVDQILLNLVGRESESIKEYKKDVLDWRP